jgi:hypothetical protein
MLSLVLCRILLCVRMCNKSNHCSWVDSKHINQAFYQAYTKALRHFMTLLPGILIFRSLKECGGNYDPLHV